MLKIFEVELLDDSRDRSLNKPNKLVHFCGKSNQYKSDLTPH
jgi:hypothetical protein